jgi:hypothetical protein
LLRNDSSSPVSLSVNYMPSKFSTALMTPGVGRRRKGKGMGSNVPKRGGGREAFKSSEARMPGEGDDDYDGVNSGWFGGKDGGRTKPRMRWNRFKWILFFSNVTVSIEQIVVAVVVCHVNGRSLLFYYLNFYSSLSIRSLRLSSAFLHGSTSGPTPTSSVLAIAPSSSSPPWPPQSVSSQPS